MTVGLAIDSFSLLAVCLLSDEHDLPHGFFGLGADWHFPNIATPGARARTCLEGRVGSAQKM